MCGAFRKVVQISFSRKSVSLARADAVSADGFEPTSRLISYDGPMQAGRDGNSYSELLDMETLKTSISERTVLHGIGASLALPFLDSMVPAFAAIRNRLAHPVRRFGVVYVPNGMAMKHWTPE